MTELSDIERFWRIGARRDDRHRGARSTIQTIQAIFLLVFAGALLQPCRAQTPNSPSTQPPSAPAPVASPSPERSVSWTKLGPNILHDQKEIWLFPVSVARGHHLKPVLFLTVVTAALVAGVDNPSGRYFQHTQDFSRFNKIFSGKNTSIAMFVAPSAVYGIGLARKNSYAQHTFLLAGEAVIDSEILTTVMKDIDRRLKPIEVSPNGSFADTWFKATQGSVIRGIASFPSGHTIAAFSLATVFADRYPKYKWVAYGLAGLVGFSRVSLQAHHPSDVFAGAVLGYAVAHYTVLRLH
jgi:membrane-associated phospholipid phosphatase